MMLLLCSQKTLVLTTAIATALPEDIGRSKLDTDLSIHIHDVFEIMETLFSVVYSVNICEIVRYNYVIGVIANLSITHYLILLAPCTMGYLKLKTLF